MGSFEENTHSFIVRIWLEPRELAGAVPEWRGVVEHAASGERRYFMDFDDLLNFIASYLDGKGGGHGGKRPGGWVRRGLRTRWGGRFLEKLFWRQRQESPKGKND